MAGQREGGGWESPVHKALLLLPPLVNPPLTSVPGLTSKYPGAFPMTLSRPLQLTVLRCLRLPQAPILLPFLLEEKMLSP